MDSYEDIDLMASRAIYLPAYEASGENATTLTSPLFKHCVTDADCKLSFICYPGNVSWINDTNVKFYQHDDVKGSLNYIELADRPTYGFCTCPTTSGWFGYACTDFHASHHFEMFLYVLTAILLFGALVLGTWDIISQIKIFGLKKAMNRTTVALILNILGSTFLFIGRVLQIFSALVPSYFVIRSDGRKRLPGIGTAVTWMDDLAGVFAAICVFQIAYCWIDVSNNVRKLKRLDKKQYLDNMQKAILFFEVSLAITSFIFLIVGLLEYLFIMVLPWAMVLLYLCTIGACRMIKILNDALSQSKEVASMASKEDEYRAIVRSIDISSKLMAFFIILTVFCALAIFYLIMVSRSTIGYPLGLWDRPLTWWTHGVFSIGVVGWLLSAFYFLHPRVYIKKKSPTPATTGSGSQNQQGNTNIYAAVRDITTIASKGDVKSPSVTQE